MRPIGGARKFGHRQAVRVTIAPKNATDAVQLQGRIVNTRAVAGVRTFGMIFTDPSMARRRAGLSTPTAHLRRARLGRQRARGVVGHGGGRVERRTEPARSLLHALSPQSVPAGSDRWLALAQPNFPSARSSECDTARFFRFSPLPLRSRRRSGPRSRVRARRCRRRRRRGGASASPLGTTEARLRSEIDRRDRRNFALHTAPPYRPFRGLAIGRDRQRCRRRRAQLERLRAAGDGNVRCATRAARGGLCRSGSVRHAHRVDCSLAASYELWTQILPENSGLIFSGSRPEIRELRELAAVRPTASGRHAFGASLGRDRSSHT